MAKTGRFVSLDIFRGLTIAFMIIVNTPGSWQYVYAPLRHAKWHGCTPADLVFPFFLFIVGVSMWFSLKKYGFRISGDSFLRISRRTLSIFALGLFLGIFPYFDRDYSYLRIMGVLQRIALVYGIGALICMSVRKVYLWTVIAAFLLLYWFLLAVFGGSEPYSLEDNFVLKTDLAILGKEHLYTGFGIPFEPEGLLSTIPAVCNVLIGFYIGDLVGRGAAKGNTVFKILTIGVAMTGLGLLWSLFFPLNKPLWSSSYVLYSSGIAMGLFSLVYWIADVGKLRKWGAFFNVFGTNALFSFFIAGVWTKIMLFIKVPAGETTISLYSWIYERIFVTVAGNMNGSLLFAITQMFVIWLFALFLFRKKIMIRL